MGPQINRISDKYERSIVMFPKRDKSMGFAAGGTTLISKSTKVVGDIHFSGNLEVEGRVEGNIYADEGSDARVRLMEKGVVEGEIKVPTIVINGSIVGNVHSAKHVELAAKAVVEGDVHYNLIEMVKGAQVNGNLLYSKDEKSKHKQSPAPKVSYEKAKSSDSAIGSQAIAD